MTRVVGGPSRVLTITISAANGLEALAALDREEVDLVLLDLMMPEMDGLSFMHAMRQHPEWSNVPVLVLSGIADLDVANKVRIGRSGLSRQSRYNIEYWPFASSSAACVLENCIRIELSSLKRFPSDEDV